MPTALQVSCVQMHWAKPLEFNLERTLHYTAEAGRAGSRVVLFPEANLTGYFFPDLVKLDPDAVRKALVETCAAARQHWIWVIAATIEKTADRFLNLTHVINPARNSSGRGWLLSRGDDHGGAGFGARRSFLHSRQLEEPALPGDWSGMIQEVEARKDLEPE